MALTRMRKINPDLHSGKIEEMDTTRLRAALMTMTQDGEVTINPEESIWNSEFPSGLMRGQRISIYNP